MRRIFTSTLMAIAFMVASLHSYAQCSATDVNPGGFPGATNLFTNNAEGFSGSFTYDSGNDLLLTDAGSGVRTITSPIFYLQPGMEEIRIRFSLRRTGSNSITSYSVSATTFAGTVELCSNTSVVISPNQTTVFYLTIPRGALAYSTNFQLNFSFNQTGSFRIDDFGTNAFLAQGTLPVKFGAFDAKVSNGKVNLAWEVGAEENVASYVVEKSLDGRGYESIASVAATGAERYSYTDAKTSENISYYRIKAVDHDGKLTYSAIVTVKDNRSSISLKAYPMPAVSELTLQHPVATSGAIISIHSAEGRTLRNQVPAKGTQQTTLNLAPLQPGIYVIRFNDGNGGVENIKIVKQ